MQRWLYFQDFFDKVYIKSKIFRLCLLWKDVKSFKTIFREQVYHVGYHRDFISPVLTYKLSPLKLRSSEVSTKPHKSMKYKENEKERKKYQRLLVW